MATRYTRRGTNAYEGNFIVGRWEGGSKHYYKVFTDDDILTKAQKLLRFKEFQSLGVGIPPRLFLSCSVQILRGFGFSIKNRLLSTEWNSLLSGCKAWMLYCHRFSLVSHYCGWIYPKRNQSKGIIPTELIFFLFWYFSSNVSHGSNCALIP